MSVFGSAVCSVNFCSALPLLCGQVKRQKRPYSPLMLSTKVDLKQLRPLRQFIDYQNENLPLELLDNPIAEEPSIFKNLDETDIINCSEALIGTIHENYFTQKFLKPQLKIFASLDVSLKESLENEGWYHECGDTK